METWNNMTYRHMAERRKLVEDLAAQRITQTVAAKYLDMTPRNLNNYIRRQGIHWPTVNQGGGRKKLPLDGRGIASMYRSGKSMKHCARAFGVSDVTIAFRLTSMGVDIRSRDNGQAVT